MLGPSGCGKTTALKMIGGFELPTSGRVLLEGVDVSTVPPWKRNVNTVFQHYALFPHWRRQPEALVHGHRVPTQARQHGRLA